MDYFTKKLVFFFLLFTFPIFNFAQEKQLANDEKQYTYGFINLTSDFGIHQINDPYLKSYYNIRNGFQWNLGFELGNTGSDFQFFLMYGSYSFRTEFFEDEMDSLGIPTGQTNKISSEAGRNRIAFGITRTEKINKKSFFTLNSGLIYNLYFDKSREIEASSPGLLIGIGYLYRGTDNLNYFVNLNYEYGNSKTNGITTDWSGLNLVTGISILIDKAE